MLALLGEVVAIRYNMLMLWGSVHDLQTSKSPKLLPFTGMKYPKWLRELAACEARVAEYRVLASWG